MSRTKAFAALATVSTLVLLGGPAWAHEEISPATIPTGRANFVTLLAANEESTALTKLTLTAPDGVTFGDATRQPAGWTAEKSKTAITWTGGSLAPASFDTWGVEVNAVNQPGPLRFRVSSGVAGGETSSANIEITAVAPGIGAPTTVAPAGTVTTTGSSDATTTTTAETASGATDGTGDGTSRANLALVVGGLGLALSLLALAAALRSRGNAGETTEATSW